MEKRLTVQKMAKSVFVVAVLMLPLIGQSDADCSSPFLSCPQMPPLQPFNVTSPSTDYNPLCSNITNSFNCYNKYVQNCSSSDQLFDSFQLVLGLQRANMYLCGSGATAYASNAVCISNYNRMMMMSSPPPTPATTGPCSSTLPFMSPGVANIASAAICGNWTLLLQCNTMGAVTACGTGAGQLIADYTTQIYLYYATKYNCPSYTVMGGNTTPTTPKASSAHRLGAGSFAIVVVTVCATLIGWRKLQA